MNPKPSKYLDRGNLTKIATIYNFLGSNGGVVLNLVPPYYEILTEEPVLVDIDGYLVPFFIDEDTVFYNKKTVSLRFTTIKSQKSATSLIGRDVYALTETLDIDEDEEEQFEYEGYTAPQEKNEFIAKVAEASNTQKPIKAKDIIANRIEQRNLKTMLAENKVFIEVKRGEKCFHEQYP